VGGCNSLEGTTLAPGLDGPPSRQRVEDAIWPALPGENARSASKGRRGGPTVSAVTPLARLSTHSDRQMAAKSERGGS
jgi:hypothetical protein